MSMLFDLALGLVAPVPFIFLVYTLQSMGMKSVEKVKDKEEEKSKVSGGSTYGIGRYVKMAYSFLPPVFVLLCYVEDNHGRMPRVAITQCLSLLTTAAALKSGAYVGWNAQKWVGYQISKSLMYWAVLDVAVPMLR